MRAIHLQAEIVLTQTPAEIGARLLDVGEWSTFSGCGPIPGIATARFRRRCEGIVGSQIEVRNRDGSSHVEEIVAWLESGEIVMRMAEFTPPLARLADHFVERWSFAPAAGGGWRVTRSFELHPRSRLGSLALRLIAPWLRRAVAQHLATLAARAG